MGLNFRRLGLSELLPRYLYAEPLLLHRRVLELGAVTATCGESAHFLVERGAKQVLAIDTEPHAVSAATARLAREGLDFQCLQPSALRGAAPERKESLFDLALVADLAPWMALPGGIEAISRWLLPNGCLVGALRNPAGLALSQVMDPEGPPAPPTYGQLLDALAPHFPAIEPSTQTPALGYQLSGGIPGNDPGDDNADAALEMDGSLAHSGEAAYFVVAAFRAEARSLSPVWVQLPVEPLAYNAGRLENQAQRSRALEEEVARLKQALDSREAELERLKRAFTASLD